MSEAEGRRPSVGDAQVDRILGALDRIDEVPVAEHAGLFLDVHDRLSGELIPAQGPREAGAHDAS